MCNVFEVAYKICEAGNWEVSNLQLQKMLYIAQVLYMGQNPQHRHLFRDKFEAWDYGPVSPAVYHKFKMFGSRPIQRWAFPVFNESCSHDENNFIESISKSLINIAPSNLVGLTHRPGTGWEKRYIPGAKGVTISEQDMQEEYEKVWLKNVN